MKKNALFLLILVFNTCIFVGNIINPPKFIKTKDVFGSRAFIENKGQFERQLKTEDKIYFAMENGLEKIYFTNKGLVYEFTKAEALTERQMEDLEKGKDNLKPPVKKFVQMNWLGSNANIQVLGDQRQGYYYTYGAAEYNSYAFKKITYLNVYNHIDIVYTIPEDKEQGIKYTVVLHPGANPNDIQIAYTGDVSKIKLNEDGNIIIKTPLDDLMEYAPSSFYEGTSENTKVKSFFTLKKNVIGFNFPESYDQTKTLLIDPWVTAIASLTSNQYAYDVDYDFGGNTFIYGGYSPFKVARYSPGGLLQWVFAGTVVTPAWSTAPIISQASNFAVNKFNSKTYIGQGYVNGGNRVIRLDALGNYDNFINTANGQFQEVWDMGFHCTTADVFVLGGGTSSNISAVTINPTTAVIGLTTFQPLNLGIAQDVVCHAIDDAGNIFVNYAGGSLTNKICLVNPAFNNNIWTQPSTFVVFTEQGNKSQYQGAGAVSSNGFNCLAVNANYLFYYDGLNLASYNKLTGVLIASTTVVGVTLKRQGGISVDDCNNLYLGGNGNIITYNFNGTTFNALTAIPLNITTTNQYVYDIQLDKQTKILYVCGSGFVGTYSPVNSLACATASSACFFSQNFDYQICAGASVTLTASNSNSLAGVSYSVQPSGLANTSGIFTVSPVTNTSYTLFTTGTNQGNVVVTQTAVSNVTVYPNPLVVPTSTQSTCTNTMSFINLGLSFNPPGSTPGYTVSWSAIPNGILTNTQTSASGLMTPGFYTAFVSTAWGCSVSTTFTINPQPEQALFTISPAGPIYILNCYNPTLTLNFTPATFNYTTTNTVAQTQYGPQCIYTSTNSALTFTALAQHPTSGCTSTQTFVINQNFALPSSVISPTFQNVTCSLTSISIVTAAISPSINVVHQWVSPLGGILTATATTSSFMPGTSGTFTHMALNTSNGCMVSKTFTVASSSGFPTYTVVSPQNFTLGCNSHSLATINIINAQTTPTPGGPTSYVFLAPGSGSNYVTGSISTTVVSVPGTWTIITKDNTNFCESRVEISVLQNTFAPGIAANVPFTILSCDRPSVVLEGISTTPNVSYKWSFPGTPGNLPNSTITILANFNASTNTLIANYTLTVVDNNSTCRSTSVIPMGQNLFKPNVLVSGGTQITCNTQTLQLTNNCTSNIPPGFGNSQPVVAYLWTGPSPQEPLQLSSTYIAQMPGTYTLLAKDSNNGCFATGTYTVVDFRDYPSVNRPDVHAPFALDCGSDSVAIFPFLPSNITSYTFSWTAVDGAHVSSINSPTLITNKLGIYELEVVNKLNGCMTQAFVEVVSGSLSADYTAEPNVGYAPLNVSFINHSSSTTGTTSIHAIWSFGNGTLMSTNSVSLAAFTTFSLAGTYSIVAYISKGACIDTIIKTVQVEIPSELEIPNIFSPNGDNVNDLFFLKATNLSEIKMLIYDRWGHKVFDSNSEKGNIAWDGKNQLGKEVAEGIYSYVLTAKGKDGNEFKKSGNITLVR